MKKVIALLAALMLLCSVALASAETITVATNPEYPPFEYVENDEVVGYDIDMIKAIAEKAGFDVEILSIAFDSVISEVISNPNTIGVSGISITDERKMNVNFADGYINAGLIVVAKVGSGYEKVEDLAGKKIGVQLGTTSDFAAVDITGETNVCQYNSFINAILDLQGNKVDAVIVDKPVGMDILGSLNDDTLEIIDMGLQADWYGIEVNKSNTDLLNRINAALAELKAEGFFDELDLKYLYKAEEEAAE